MTKVKADSLDEQYVRIMDKDHQMFGFFGEAAFDPYTNLYDVIEEENGRVLRTVENLRLEQLKAA